MATIAKSLATELAVHINQVAAAIALLDEGATVPFIARYRKEATGGLDDTQLRHLSERLGYLRELEARRQTILKSIESQQKLTPALQQALESASSKTELEDLYLPYKPKRRTKAHIAREAGLEPLAQQLWQRPESLPEQAAVPFIDADKGVESAKAALDGARQILMEQWAEEATLVAELRQLLWQEGVVIAKGIDESVVEGKFADYADYHQAVAEIPPHRLLALFRGQSEGALTISLELSTDRDLALGEMGKAEAVVARHVGFKPQQRPADSWLQESIRWCWRVKLATRLETDIMSQLREGAEGAAIEVFARNLKDLLLAAPAGHRPTMGLDPGFRTGVKVAVVDGTGKLLETVTIYPHVPQRQWDSSLAQLKRLAERHRVELVSIGNGTASRETEKLVAELLQRYPQLNLTKVVVSEAGASVYSASELAANEFPKLDVSLRGAVSIARRLQDPLAELVKIDPKSIGVGQYQHDVASTRLQRALVAVVEDCVNGVGVDINTASTALLSHVAGLNGALAANVVEFRDGNGPFRSRQQLLKVPRLGPKAFEQCAGFLRILGGDNPLDASAVHPEAYPIVERIIAKTGRSIAQLLGAKELLGQLAANDFIDDRFGEPTVRDIIGELEKPGRDPRPEFRTASFKEGIETLADLKPEMILEGVVTNVTHFGAFVDVGVHQDGLVHISMLADKFVKDPHEVVKAGEIVKVKVVEVDVARKRIALSMRLQEPRPTEKSNGRGRSRQTSAPTAPTPSGSAAAGAMAEAFRRAAKG
ncbi:RNA-binding transcriptional accessory protein [Ectothiorhodospiraceae bacterium BW-2]|nr:RNA-binding transcriptional accessory protein [Ectothiorhodospiraceae bacterium BW-2]